MSLGPVENDSNDEQVNYHRNKRESTFSTTSATSKPHPLFKKPQILDEFSSDSSDAPNFSLSEDFDGSPSQSHSSHKHRVVAEAGRDKIVFKNCSEGFCNLIGREFPEDEHVLSSNDVLTV